MNVNVTKELIGTRRGPTIAGEHEFHGAITAASRRVIAQAIKTALPTAQRVSVDLQAIRFTDPEQGLRLLYLTPRVAQTALIDMDLGQPVKPFSFRLSKPRSTTKVRR